MSQVSSEPKRVEISPEELHEDMTAGGIINALQHLPFTKGVGLLSIDRSVRHYIVRALRQR